MATPGRLEDLINQRAVRLDEVDVVVVDEADRMADMGFLPSRAPHPRRGSSRPPDAAVLGHAGRRRRRSSSAPTSATRCGTAPSRSDSQGPVDHQFWSVSPHDRVSVTAGIVARSWPAIVFCRTKHGAERVAKQLNRTGVRAQAIHGDRSQGQRERALAAFTTGAASRCSSPPTSPPAASTSTTSPVSCSSIRPTTDKDYIHRSGRTGRAGAAGTVITLVTPEKAKDVRKMQRALGMDVRAQRRPRSPTSQRPTAPGLCTVTSPTGHPVASGPRRTRRDRRSPPLESWTSGPADDTTWRYAAGATVAPRQPHARVSVKDEVSASS